MPDSRGTPPTANNARSLASLVPSLTVWLSPLMASRAISTTTLPLEIVSRDMPCRVERKRSTGVAAAIKPQAIPNQVHSRTYRLARRESALSGVRLALPLQGGAGPPITDATPRAPHTMRHPAETT